MARPGRPERNRAARSFRQLKRFHHVINSNKAHRAYIAVELARTIQKRPALVQGAARSEPLSVGAVVDVAGRIISKVVTREGAITPASTCQTQVYVARCPSLRPASSALEPFGRRYPRQAAP